ncbi:MAG: GGDEF domain-containing protein [Phycisphaerae bacterium]|nr:GGDEF domain-containing protein [Phycisphaerae bacterium]
MKSAFYQRLESGGRLPTPPGVVIRLLEITRQPDTSVREIADTIAADPILAAKILRFVNSPMAGVARQVSSLHQAVALLGVRGVKMMALSFSVLTAPAPTGCKRFDPKQFTVQSLACGTAAKVIAAQCKSNLANEAFVVGLLSQIGRSVIAAALPAEYERVLSSARLVPEDLPALERAAFGEDYTGVGAQLLRGWGIPEPVCTVIETFRGDGGEDPPSDLKSIIRVAEIAASVACPDPHAQTDNPDRFIQSAARLLGFSEAQAMETLNSIVTEVEDTRRVLDLPPGFMRSVEELEGAVRERISELTFALHVENQSMARQQEDLLHRATTDALTGVGNRAAFDARLAQELERSARAGTSCALLMIDVDRFKSFNDTYGHQAGDQTLKVVAETLDQNIRKVDYVARYGGEEFVVIAPNTTVEGIMTLAERLRQTMEVTPVRVGGRSLTVTFSVGVALMPEVSDTGPNTSNLLIRAADEQLYAAKRSGRNAVQMTVLDAMAAAEA